MYLINKNYPYQWYLLLIRVLPVNFMKRYFLLLVGILSFSMNLCAQDGYVRGVLLDEETQEPLIGGVVQIEGTSLGTVTDIEGAYSITVPTGTYNVKHSYVGYQDKIVSDVTVNQGEVNALGNVSLGMEGSASDLEAVVVTAYVQKNSDEGLLNFQRESSKILDAVSAQAIAKTGDSDVAAVVRRMPGVTVEKGKYVFVRGLSDRYSKSILNGMELPGLDPERNTVQMDIFSSKIIDHVVVYKTFSPDLSGDFTGGMVDVVTKDFPLEKTINFSASMGYNTEATFNDSYIGYSGDSFSDALGFGNKSRKIPVSSDFNPSNESKESIFNATNKLTKNVQIKPEDNLFNNKVAFSYGNQIPVKNNFIGFNAGINYQDNYNQKNNWQRNNISYVNGKEDIENSDYRNGSVGGNDGLLSGLLNTAYKFDQGKVSLKLMHTRTGETASAQRLSNDEFDDQLFSENIIDYFQRTLTNGVLASEYFLGQNKDNQLSFNLSGSRSTVDNPERLNSVMFVDQNTNELVFASNSDFTKEWRSLEESNINGRLDYELPFIKKYKTDKNTLKFGGAYNFKNRDFQPTQIEVAPSNFFDASLSTVPNNDLDNILKTDNIVNQNKAGYGINVVQIDLANKYQSDMGIAAAYGMTNWNINEQLKFIGGLRVENAIMNFDGYSDGKPIKAETLNSLQFLPSANVVYELKDYMNLRASYNRTLARPSFKEKTTANIYDAVSNQFFIGNIDLKETTINNYDLRWEYYFGSTEMVSLSPFYKQFYNPIEMSFINANQIKPINKDKADVYGVEFELRKNFGFINSNLEHLALNTNVTFAQSKIALTDNEKLKYYNGNAPAERHLVGQSPFSFNAGLDYQSDSGWLSNLSYNVKGKTLDIVGFSTQTYDVYEDPFNSLNFKFGKRFNDKIGSKITLTTENILGDNIEYYYELDGKKLNTYQTYDIGRTFKLGYSFDIR